MTRALSWLVRGDLTTALGYHPLAPVVAIAGLGLMAWWIGRRLRGWRTPPIRFVNAGLISFGVLLVTTWVVRIGTGTLPPV
jgi:hypothetical protein